MAQLFTRSFVALLLAQASFGFAFSSYFLLPKFLATELGAGPAEIGLVGALWGGTYMLLGPLLGVVVDRRGRRPFLVAGALLWAVTSLAFAGVEELGAEVYVLRALQGAAFAMAFVAGSALAVDEAPPERLALALGVFGLTMLSMNAVAPALVEELAARAGWGRAFQMSAASAGLAALLSLRVRERPHPEPGQEIPSLWDVARRPGFPRIALVVGLAGVAFTAMFTFHQPFALELGIERLRSFFVAYTVAAVVARLGVGPYVDRLGTERVSLAALVLYGVSTLAMGWLGVLGLAALGAAFGLAHGLFYPTFNAVAVRGIGPHERGKAMALFNGAFNVGGTLGVLALGLAAEALGYPPVFVLAGAGALAGAVVLASGLVTGSRTRPAPPAHESGGS
jgi:MFS family permease